VVLAEVRDSLVMTNGVRVGVVGVSDLVVIVTEEGVLVAHKSASSSIRDVAAELLARDG
jgi:hypothetical protein